MRAFHRPTADIQRRADDLIDFQSLCSNRGADDVDHRVDRTHLVKMHLLDRSSMNLCLRSSQGFKDRDGGLLGGLTDFRVADDVANFAQPARVRMRVTVWFWPRRMCVVES